MRTGLIALVLFTAASLAAAATQEKAQAVHTVDDGDLIVASGAETDVVRVIQRALQVLGYDPGPADGEIGARTRSALSRYRESKRFAETEAGLFLTLESLALELSTKRVHDSEAILIAAELSSALHRNASEITAQNTGIHCVNGHRVASIGGNGEVVALEDGSLFEVERSDRVDTMLWLPNEEVLTCGRKLANMDAGDAVLATRIR